jgi:hypothetical protein
MSPHDSLYVESRKLALDQGSFFVECLPALHSTKGAPMDPYASPFVKGAVRHLTKKLLSVPRCAFFVEC